MDTEQQALNEESGAGVEQLVASERGQLFVEVEGDGPATLVMPVAWGMSHDFYQELLEPLTAFLQLVYFDPLGVGGSDPLPDDCTSHEILEEAEAVRDVLGVERIVVFGHASGAYNALAYAVRYPEHVSALILVNAFASYRRASELGAALLERIPTWDEFQMRAEDIRRVHLAPTEQARAIYKEQRTVDLVDYVPHYLRLAELAERTDFNPQMHDDLEGDLTDELASIRVPVLLTVGMQDALCPAAETHAIAARLPNVRVLEFPCSRHFPFIEEPERFVRGVRMFVEQLQSAPR